jgi:large subunit ribosomal protein L25
MCTFAPLLRVQWYCRHAAGIRVTLFLLSMKTIEITGIERSVFGKKNAHALRSKGYVPCNLYGSGEDKNVNFAVEERALKALLYTPSAYLVCLNIDGKQETGVLREVQYHPVTDAPLHIDFFRVNNAKPISIAVPVELTGTSEGVKLGGKLQHITRRLKISALPEKLPDNVTIDISHLALGKSIFVGDISVDDITILTPKSAVVCAVKMTRAAMGAAQAAAKQNTEGAGTGDKAKKK